MDRARTANGVLVWTLSLVLAGVFLVAGIPKITGTDAVGLQAASMQAFPGWLRVVVGAVEVAGAIGLVIPALAAYAALGLALLMVPASITQYMSGEPGLYVPVGLFVLLLVLAWRRDPAATAGLYRSVRDTPRPVLREGAIAGIVGATCVAAWFFIVDFVAGRPLFTPETLGHALFTVLRNLPVARTPVLYLLGYTVFHYAVFILVGIVAAGVFAWAGKEPAILIGFLILFIAFEVGFYGFVALLQQASALGDLAWYQVMIGNLIAAIGMGVYMWRAHPRLQEQLTHAFDTT